ncbi:hypothetical protein H7J93_14670 [Mycobacterium barrassiae]|uniref:hypothetical protein n=1 Tax=Mycobacterium barrassiae TaxID=319709 RepID=UPI002265F621|nr:hypothetical protein [Mycobacterium barrassiae]MCV7300867.1 hypothetical protein [Mycobacterium barrassiae]
MSVTPANDIEAFERVIAAWSEPVDCEAHTKLGAQCRRPAHWRLDLHGCETVLLCRHHLRAWELKARSTMAPWCAVCGGRWPSINDAYSVTPL